MAGIRLVGIDLAWHGVKPSGVALGRLYDQTLYVDQLLSEVLSNDELCSIVREYNALGVAIDAPLIINNQNGMRECERQIGMLYGAKGASCHTANLSLFPNATSVQLSELLQKHHYEHIVGTRWQIEVYPHPAIIELFNLDYRLAYKKGSVAERKAGQLILASYLQSMGDRLPFTLALGDGLQIALTEADINKLKGEQLKHNEDRLDSIVCLVIAALHFLNKTQVVGAEQDGYIVLPLLSDNSGSSFDDNQLSVELFNLLSHSEDELMKSRGQLYSGCSGAERDEAFKHHLKLKKAFERKVASLDAPQKIKSNQSRIIKSCAALLCRAFLQAHPNGKLTKIEETDISLYQFAQNIVAHSNGELDFMDKTIEITDVKKNKEIQMAFSTDSETKPVEHETLRKALERAREHQKKSV